MRLRTKLMNTTKAASMAEYAILMSLIGVASITALLSFGTDVKGTNESINMALNNPSGLEQPNSGNGGNGGSNPTPPPADPGNPPAQVVDCFDPASVGMIGTAGTVCEDMLIVDDTLLKSAASANVGGNQSFELTGPGGVVFTFAESPNRIFTGQVRNLDSVFASTSFNGDIGYWDVSQVESMSNTFAVSAFNQDISSWNVGSVENFEATFFLASQFDQPIGSWDVGSAVDMSGMFYGTPFNQNITGWDVSSVEFFYSTFSNTSQFNQPIGSWNVSGAVDMANMFNGAANFNHDLSGWDVSSVADFTQMFAFTPEFNQPLDTWDISSAVNMDGMFAEAVSFNQDLSTWCVLNILETPFQFDQGTVSWAGGTATRPQWGGCVSPESWYPGAFALLVYWDENSPDRFSITYHTQEENGGNAWDRGVATSLIYGEPDAFNNFGLVASTALSAQAPGTSIVSFSDAGPGTDYDGIEFPLFGDINRMARFPFIQPGQDFGMVVGLTGSGYQLDSILYNLRDYSNQLDFRINNEGETVAQAEAFLEANGYDQNICRSLVPFGENQPGAFPGANFDGEVVEWVGNTENWGGNRPAGVWMWQIVCADTDTRAQFPSILDDRLPVVPHSSPF